MNPRRVSEKRGWHYLAIMVYAMVLLATGRGIGLAESNDFGGSQGAGGEPGAPGNIQIMSEANVALGLEGYWNLDEAQGEIARDSSGNEYHAVLFNGPGRVAGKFGLGLDFDGSDSYADLGKIDIQGEAVTISMWVNASALHPNIDSRLISKAEGVREQDHYWMLSLINGDKLRFRLKTAGVTHTLIAETSRVEIGKWTHVLAVYDGQSMMLYQDGELAGSRQKTGSIDINGDVAAFIGMNPDRTNGFNGILDEVRIYSRALGIEEITALSQEEPENQAPVAHAGEDAIVLEGDRVGLDGSRSADPDNDPITARWEQVSGPAVDLDDPTALTPSFIAPEIVENTELVFELTVSDGELAHADRVAITVDNLLKPPVTLTARAVSARQIRLSWEVEEDGATLFEIFRGDLPAGTSTSTGFLDTGLVPGTSYTYTVTAKDGAGRTSAPSAPAEAVTPALKYYTLSTSAVNGKVHVFPDLEKYEEGSVITLQAQPDANYAFRAWQGAELAPDPEVTLQISENLTITALFDLDISGDLTGFWNLDEGAGTLAADLSSNQYHGSVEDAVWGEGRIGPALEFNGTGSHINLGAIDVDPGDQMSMALWVKPESLPPRKDQRLISKADGVYENSHYWMLSTYNGDKLRFRLKTGSKTSTLVAGDARLVEGQWTHVAAVYDGTSMMIYQDGQLKGSLAKTGACAVNTGITAALGMNPDGTNHFNGTLDEVRLYSRALSRDEVLALYNEAGQPQTYTLTVSGTNGQVVKDPAGDAYEAGTRVKLTAVPDPGFRFDSWDDAGLGSGNPGFVTMDDNKSVTARFSSVIVDPLSVESVQHQGLDCFKITTPGAIYFFDKKGGGFVSILDPDGNDWISHNDTPGATGKYRGIPNLCENGDYFHPGFDTCTTAVTFSSPSKITLTATAKDGTWETQWDFYHDRAQMEVTQASGNYWFLYEGTPGGSMDPDRDYYVTSSGIQNSCAVPMNTDLSESTPGSGEWVYFGDRNQARVFFLIHHEEDSLEDQYFNLSNEMTVMGFGRSGMAYSLSGKRKFTIGFVESQDPAVIKQAIETGISLPFKEPVFTYHPIDASAFAQGKATGDINNDGYVDIVLAEGEFAKKFSWYKHLPPEGWIEFPINNSIMAQMDYVPDAKTADLDNDGDLDIIVPNDGSPRVVWILENPLKSPAGDGNPETDEFILHTIPLSTNGHLKDVDTADFNRDGKIDIVIRAEEQVLVLYQQDLDNFTVRAADVHAHEGMAAGDIDGDSLPDVVGNGWWLKNPGAEDVAGTPWTLAVIDDQWFTQTTGAGWQMNACRVKVADMNQDGLKDPVLSHSELPGFPVAWYERSPVGTWLMHTIGQVDRCHTLETGDVNNDGFVDVIAGTLETVDQPKVVVFLNRDRTGTDFKESVMVRDRASYIGKVGDMDNDGDLDFASCSDYNNGPFYWLKNTLDPTTVLPLDRWTHSILDSSRTIRSFGLATTDPDNNGYRDILSGAYLYRNSGSGTDASFEQRHLPAGVDFFLTANVDDDELLDIIGQKTVDGQLTFYWAEAKDENLLAWNSPVAVAALPKASHSLGSQGHKTGQIVNGGKEEIVVSTGNGIYYLEIPEDPETGSWSAVHVNATPSDEGFGLFDIDGDGDLDIAAGTGNSRNVEWYENPGTATGNWHARHVGNTVEWGDRFEIGDLNADGRPDIIGSEENGRADGASVYWWEQPLDLSSPSWVRHTLVTQASTNSLGLADMDQDGDLDIVTGEHKGTEKVSIWKNNGRGSFEEVVVAEGIESHLGTVLSDLDSDGDLDILSIAWDDRQYLHLWENQALKTDGSGTGEDTTAPEISSVISGTGHITLIFDEVISEDSALDPANYAVDNGVEILSVSLDSSGTLVTLHTTPLSTGTVYTVTVTGIEDLHGNAIVNGEDEGVEVEEILVSDGLQAFWDFNDVPGEVAADRSGNGRTATLENAQSTGHGRIQSGLDVNGLNARANAGSFDIAGDSGLSLSLWFRPDTPVPGDARLISKATGPGEDAHIYMLSTTMSGDQTRLRFRLKTGGTTSTLVADSGQSPAGEWSHAVAVYDGSRMQLYLNGSPVGSLDKSGDVETGAGVPLWIGANPDSSNFFDGSIDEVRIYNRALTETEILTLYEEPGEEPPAETYTLTLTAENGSITALPDREAYAEGSRVSLTAVPDPGFVFDAWDDPDLGTQSITQVHMTGDIQVTARFKPLVTTGATYYIDFENGDDTYSGISPERPWQHAPGDANAAGFAKTAEIEPGDTLMFKGGVQYRGSIRVNESGTGQARIRYIGNQWPQGERAVITGAESVSLEWTPCTPEDVKGNPNAANIYMADLPENYGLFSSQFFDGDEGIYPAQDPNISDPFWVDRIDEYYTVQPENITRTSITDRAYFSGKPKDYFDNSHILIWVQPNIIKIKKVTGYLPEENKILFEELDEINIYGDRPQYFSILNNLHYLDRAGEYVLDEANAKLYYWPKASGGGIGGAKISIAHRYERGIDTRGNSHLLIEGFKVTGYTSTHHANAITNSFTWADNENITIRDNEITYIRTKNGKKGSIFFSSTNGLLIEDNYLHDNPRNTGIMIGSNNVVIRNNHIRKCGYKGIWSMGSENVRILNNHIHEIQGTHATAVSIFTTKDILFADNYLHNSMGLFSFQGIENLVVHNNLIYFPDDTTRGDVIRENGWDSKGYLMVTNNTALRSEPNVAMNMGGSHADPSKIIARNNIVDGWGKISVQTQASNNIYTGLCWNQSSKYDWHLMEGEKVEENLDTLFTNPDENDYSLREDSPARDGGIDLDGLIPDTILGLFPEYDFSRDMTGKPRGHDGHWDMGALEL